MHFNSLMLRDPLDDLQKGFLLETLLLSELRAFLAYSQVGGELSYWRSGQREVDFVLSRGKKRISVEVRATSRWRAEFSGPSIELLETKTVTSAYAVYCGERAFDDRGLQVRPFAEFVKGLFRGEIWE